MQEIKSVGEVDRITRAWYLSSMIYQLNTLTAEKLQQIGEKLADGEVGVLPTDTIYGIVGSALKPATVEQIYRLRKRNPEKPMIILIGSLDQLKLFNVALTPDQTDFLKQHWPNPVSIILPVNDQKFEYLHRGKNSLAFRFPQPEWLQKLLNISGPLVAPSANFEGETSASTIEEAQSYFGDNISFYLGNGRLENPASTLVDLTNGHPVVLRQGSVQL